MTTEDIIGVTCDTFQITIEQLTSNTRTQELADARAIITHLLIENQLEYRDNIGRLLRKDRTSVYNMAKKFHNDIRVDKLFRHKFNEINKRIQNL